MTRPVHPCTFAHVLGRPLQLPEAAPNVEPIDEADASLDALTATLIPLLARYDELWAETRRLNQVASKMVGCQPPWNGPKARWDAYVSAHQDAHEESGYNAAWERSNAIDQQIVLLVEAFMEAPAQTLQAIVLKWRVSESVEQFEGAALSDLRRLWEDEPCT